MPSRVEGGALGGADLSGLNEYVQAGRLSAAAVRQAAADLKHPAAEAWIFLDRSCWLEGLLHFSVNNAG